MKKILITGGSGFLGRDLATKLSSDYEVILGSRNNGLNRKAQEITNCEAIPLDVSSLESVKDCFLRYSPNIVIHAAATKYVDLSENQPFECIDVNVLGSENIARVSIESNVEKVVGISTDKTAPPIGNIYGYSKAIMERMFCSLDGVGNTKFSCVRFGNIAWSTGSVFPIWKSMTESSGLIESTGPDMRRFFFSVDEASKLVLRCMDNFDLLHGKILSKVMKSAQISDLLDIWCELFDSTWTKVDPRPGDKEDEYLIGILENKNTFIKELDEIKHFVIDFSKLAKSHLKDPFSSKDAQRLSKEEMLELIQSPSQNG
jgi:UDP-glucose 4-epimerase